jgi:hypothetical protein
VKRLRRDAAWKCESVKGLKRWGTRTDSTGRLSGRIHAYTLVRLYLSTRVHLRDLGALCGKTPSCVGYIVVELYSSIWYNMCTCRPGWDGELSIINNQ